MNILGIDFGTKYIGLSWMQEGLDVVLPYGRLVNTTFQPIPTELINLIQQEHITGVVLGLPLTLEDGSENANTKRVRAFAKELHALTKLPIFFVDERLSSFQADDMGGSASRDEKAAMVILETYKLSGAVDTLS